MFYCTIEFLPQVSSDSNLSSTNSTLTQWTSAGSISRRDMQDSNGNVERDTAENLKNFYNFDQRKLSDVEEESSFSSNNYI